MRLQAKNEPEIPILLSFFPRKGKKISYKIIAVVGNFVKALRFSRKIEIGDSLLPHRIFVHYFDKDEIENELHQAGFKMVEFSSENYGYAIKIFDVK